MEIRKITKDDYSEYAGMVKEFYSGEAVMHALPDEFYDRSFNYFVGGGKMGDCYFCVDGGDTVGYAVTAYTWSQEAGGEVCWIEELFVKPDCRGKGYAKFMLESIMKACAPARFRLEVEPENVVALNLYKACGFEFIPYRQMIKEILYKK